MSSHKVLNGDSLAKMIEYLETHYQKLDSIVKAIEDSRSTEEYARKKSMVALDGTGAGTIEWDVPLGYDWLLERVTVTSTGNGTVTFFIDTTSPSDQVEVIGSTQLYSDAFTNNIHAPEGSKVYAVFTNAGINGQATVNLQVKVIPRKKRTHQHRHLNVGDA